MTKENKERNDQVVELAKTYNTQEIADHFGITRERVRQILNARGVNERHFTSHNSILAESSDLIGEMPDAEIASMYDLHPGVILRIRNKKGIKRYKKDIGCPKCVTEHYARGLCRNCWTLAQRRGLLNEFELNVEFDSDLQKCAHDGCRRMVFSKYCWQHEERYTV